MPESFDISTSSGCYRVSTGRGLLTEALRAREDVVILTDAYFSGILPTGIGKVIAVPALEGSKSLEQIAPIIAKLRELGAHRRTHLLALGGGVIQDIATFVASIYMRGIAWTYFPTTLLSMVDSCVGGKSSINVYSYKNLVGNFYPPAEVMIDLDFLRSLNAEQIVGGLCEAAKICYARSSHEYDLYLAESPAIKMSALQAERIIVRSIKAKQWFIEIDEFDKKERLLLNFGHTFGHAIESATEFRITHGVAVGVGMVVAHEYAKQRGFLTATGSECVLQLTTHIEQLLRELPPLAEELRRLDIDVFMEKFDNDKKHHADQYRIVIPKGDGSLELVSIARTEEGRSAIKAAFRAAIHRLADPTLIKNYLAIK